MIWPGIYPFNLWRDNIACFHMFHLVYTPVHRLQKGSCGLHTSHQLVTGCNHSEYNRKNRKGSFVPPQEGLHGCVTVVNSSRVEGVKHQLTVQLILLCLNVYHTPEYMLSP